MPEQFSSSNLKSWFRSVRLIFLAPALLVLITFSIAKLNWTTNPISEVTFTTITGKKIPLKDLKGKPVIVTFWATDCPECLKEIPILIDLYKKYHTKGLEIIAIAMHYDPPNLVINLSEALKLPYDVALDLTRETATAFGNIELTPSTFLIGPDSFINVKKVGAFDPVEIKTRIEILLKG